MQFAEEMEFVWHFIIDGTGSDANYKRNFHDSHDVCIVVSFVDVNNLTLKTFFSVYLINLCGKIIGLNRENESKKFFCPSTMNRRKQRRENEDEELEQMKEIMEKNEFSDDDDEVWFWTLWEVS